MNFCTVVSTEAYECIVRTLLMEFALEVDKKWMSHCKIKTEWKEKSNFKFSMKRKSTWWFLVAFWNMKTILRCRVDAQSKVYVHSFFIGSKLTNVHGVIQFDALFHGNPNIFKSEQVYTIQPHSASACDLRESHHFMWWCICFCLLTRDAIKIRKIGEIFSYLEVSSEIFCAVGTLAMACNRLASIGYTFQKWVIFKWGSMRNQESSSQWVMMLYQTVARTQWKLSMFAKCTRMKIWAMEPEQSQREIRCGMLKWERFNNVHHIHFHSEYILFWTFSP